MAEYKGISISIELWRQLEDIRLEYEDEHGASVKIPAAIQKLVNEHNKNKE